MLQVANIRQGMDLGLMLTGVPLVVLSRALNIYPLAYLVNKGAPTLGRILSHGTPGRQFLSASADMRLSWGVNAAHG